MSSDGVAYPTPPKVYACSLNSRIAPGGDDLDRRIYILGVGNIGRLYASCLSKIPNPPPITLVVHRKEQLAQWKESEGIEITRAGVTEKIKNFDIEYWSDTPLDSGHAREIANAGNIKNLIIATKASAAYSELYRVRRYLNPTSTVAFAQNGMSKFWPPSSEILVKDFFARAVNDRGKPPNILACVTTHGVTSLGPFKSNHASIADVKFGPVLLGTQGHKADYLIETLVKAPQLNSQLVSTEDLWILQLEKLVVNSVINPITAISRVKNGDLFVNKEGVLAKAIDRLLREASEVIQCLHTETRQDQIAVDNSTPYSSPPLEERFSVESLREMLWEVGHKVKDNTSSMLQDMRVNRPTEVNAFNGWFVDMARFLDKGLDVSTHMTLINMVECKQTMTLDRLAEQLLAK